MKAVLIAENWPPRVGGIENYLTHIASYLPRGSVEVVAPRGSVGVPGAGIKQMRTFRFFWPLLRPAWLPFFISLYRSYRTTRPNVILCGKALFEGLVAYYLKRHLHIPYIVFTYAMEIMQWSASPRLRRRLQRVLREADRIVYINDVTKQHLLGLGATEKQLVKIWPGVDDRFFGEVGADEKRSVLERYGLTQPYIVSVGRLIPRKGFDRLIEAFSRLDSIRFSTLKIVIVGSGPQQKELASLARQLLIGPSVVFLTAVPDTDLPALYGGAEFFALTPTTDSKDMEGFGIVYSEAAACGKSAIATQGGGAGEAVRHRVSGLVVEPTVAAITQALTTLLTHSELRKQLEQAAKQLAWNEFRWKKRILLVKGMIDAIVSEHL